MLNIINKNLFYQLLLAFFLTGLAYCNIFPNRLLSFEINHDLLVKAFSFQSQELFFMGNRFAQSLSGFLGTSLFKFHAFSLVLHLTNIFVVYKIVQKLSFGKLTALLAALFFGVHPAQTEAVTQITNFPILLGTLGILGSFYWYLKSEDNKSPTTQRYLIFSVILLILTSLFFRQALIFPLIIFVFQFGKNDSLKNSLQKSAFYAIPAGLILLVAYLIPSNGNMNYLYDSFLLNLLTAIKAMGRYVITALVPLILSYNPSLSEGIYARFPEDFDKYSFLSQSFLDLPVLISIGLLLIIFIFLKKAGRNNRLIILGGAWFFLSLLPVISIWPTEIFYSETYLYMANFGYAVFLAACFSPMIDNKDILSRKGFLTWTIITTMVFFGVVQSWMRNLDWRNDKNFYGAAVLSNPHSYLMKVKLAQSYIKGLESDKGIALLNEMILKYPQKSELYVLLAQAYRNFNQNKMAIKMLEKAIAVDPENADAYFKLSEIYATWKIYHPAYQNLDKAIYYYKKQGKFKEAERIEGILKEYVLSTIDTNEAAP